MECVWSKQEIVGRNVLKLTDPANRAESEHLHWLVLMLFVTSKQKAETRKLSHWGLIVLSHCNWSDDSRYMYELENMADGLWTAHSRLPGIPRSCTSRESHFQLPWTLTVSRRCLLCGFRPFLTF